MAWIDDFMTSKLKAEIDLILGAGGMVPPVYVSFDALALACQSDVQLESDIDTAITAILAATGWEAKVRYSERMIRFTK